MSVLSPHSQGPLMFRISKIRVIYLQDAKEILFLPAPSNLQEILGSRTQYPTSFLASVVENTVLWCHWHSRAAEAGWEFDFQSCLPHLELKAKVKSRRLTRIL